VRTRETAPLAKGNHISIRSTGLDIWKGMGALSKRRESLRGMGKKQRQSSRLGNNLGVKKRGNNNWAAVF